MAPAADGARFGNGLFTKEETRKMRSRAGVGGFTLVELIVVLVAVLIITSIVYPMFSHPHGEASHTQCTRNVKQLALAMQMYSQDYVSQYPGIDGSGWVSKIAPYLGSSSQMFQCPSDTTGDGVVSYAMSGLMIREDGTGVKESQVNSPAEVAVLCDATPSRAYPSSRILGGGAQQPLSVIGAEPATRHSKGLIVGFADGHAKYFQGAINKADEGNGAMRALYHAAPLGLINNPTAGIPDGCEITGLSGTVLVGGEYPTRPFLMAAAQMYGNYYTNGFKGEYYWKGPRKDGWAWGTASTDPRRVAKNAVAFDAVCIIVARGSKIPFLPAMDNSTYAVTIPLIRKLFETGYEQNTVQVYLLPGDWCSTNTYVKRVIGNTGWGVDSIEVADDAEMVEKIANDPYGIGYCSSAFADPDRVVVLAPIIRGKTYVWPQADRTKRWIMPTYAKSDWPWKRSLDVTASDNALGRGIAASLRTGALAKKGLAGGPLFTWGYWPGDY